MKIVEAYTNYTPEADYVKLTQRLLDTVPEKYLVGLDSVVLCNLSGASRRERRGTLPRKKRRVKRANVAGLYHRARRGQRAWIQLYVDQIKLPPRPLLWIRFLCDLLFGSVLYHELGHHAHTIKPEFREKEDVADSWSGRFGANHIRKALLVLVAASLACGDHSAMVSRKAKKKLNEV